MIPSNKRNVITIGDGKPLLLSEEGLRRLKEKLKRLSDSLPNLITEAQRTAAYGDRSENFEYQQAKGTLRRTKIQIMTLEDQINRATVIRNTVSGVVGLGSTVVVESSEGKQATFQILGSHETDPAKGRISNESPLGAVLLGKKIGESVAVRIGTNTQTYQIIRIS